VVVAPSQNLTPIFTSQVKQGHEALAASYAKASAMMQLAGAAAMAGLALGAPVISFIWLGRVQPLFIGYSAMLALGWFCNIASTPGYYLGIASGRLRWNIAGAVTTSTAAAGLGLLLGRLWGPLGIAAGAMTALMAGNFITWLLNCRDLRLRVLPTVGDWWSLMAAISRNPLLPLQARATKA
jgi:O-antigen/teichoic acid export membrane protein